MLSVHINIYELSTSMTPYDEDSIPFTLQATGPTDALRGEGSYTSNKVEADAVREPTFFLIHLTCLQKSRCRCGVYIPAPILRQLAERYIQLMRGLETVHRNYERELEVSLCCVSLKDLSVHPFAQLLIWSSAEFKSLESSATASLLI